jgi:hypothetical protein
MRHESLQLAPCLAFAQPTMKPSVTVDVMRLLSLKARTSSWGWVAISQYSPDTCPYLCACISRQLRNPSLYNAHSLCAPSCLSDKGRGQPKLDCPTRLPLGEPVPDVTLTRRLTSLVHGDESPYSQSQWALDGPKLLCLPKSARSVGRLPVATAMPRKQGRHGRQQKPMAAAVCPPTPSIMAG